MWTRALLKENAKIAFKRNYWTCVIVSVILMLVGGGASETSSLSVNVGEDNSVGIEFSGQQLVMLSVITVVALIVVAFAIVFSIFVTNVLTIGGKRYFMENREHKTLVGQIFYGFQSGNYMNCVKTMFFRDLYVFGWSLLLIIPGIVKAYSYYMVPYILAENPDLSKDRVLELSSEMMDGHKMETFVLELSFFGWNILNTATFGILGIFYVNPYIHATYAELYAAIKADAMGRGITDEIELPGFSYPQYQQEFTQEFQQEETFEDEDIFAED